MVGQLDLGRGFWWARLGGCFDVDRVGVLVNLLFVPMEFSSR